ncbi:metal ABC transporter substrate-binding protein [Arthrobacter flavus]|uniref:Metal ABC transporter substrate-binding protein n=1 Tax=Arthrobacter flavus TaxID=95172 RepID=A0ABW4Q4E3_9MICC
MAVLRRSLALPVVLALTLSACGPTAGVSGDGDAPLDALASFYPLQFVVQAIAGDAVDVGSVTPPGAEPHNLELSPAMVSDLAEASVVVYASGFQPAVDEAVIQVSPDHVIDVAGSANLQTADGSSLDDGSGTGSADPHFWLDPQRLAAVAEQVQTTLSEIDPDNAATYGANADQLTQELSALDEEYRTGLAACARDTIVVSHEAYGYLVTNYGLEQMGIAGIDPEAEPAPARVAKIQRVIEGEDVTTIFTESLVNPKVAETIAADLGIQTAVLDPLETLADPSSDYLTVMRSNLTALQEALGCE